MKTDKQNCLILVSGGARSGKSNFAEALAEAVADRRGNADSIAYIATGQAMDPEFSRRIDAHQQRRSKRFITYEEPLELEGALAQALSLDDIALVECIPTWLGNLYHYSAPEKIAQRLETMVAHFRQQCANESTGPASNAATMAQRIVRGERSELSNMAELMAKAKKIVITVTNETGLGIVPSDAASRRYRDDLGWLNQHLAAMATAVFFSVAGIARQIK
jgi:adenosyl cobinamide kinase/adenosyl cobinamide phosphate guanylyltransferase